MVLVPAVVLRSRHSLSHTRIYCFDCRDRRRYSCRLRPSRTCWCRGLPTRSSGAARPREPTDRKWPCAPRRAVTARVFFFFFGPADRLHLSREPGYTLENARGGCRVPRFCLRFCPISKPVRLRETRDFPLLGKLERNRMEHQTRHPFPGNHRSLRLLDRLTIKFKTVR